MSNRTLVVAFGEEYDRKGIENAVQNFSLINKIVLNLVKNETRN
jgi:hypothetical protein